MGFIQNGWYCCGFSDKISTTPVQEIILDRKVAIFRTAGGHVTALDDRCPHRFVPLSMGKVVGEEIVCPYHGLQFGTNGVCTYSPQGGKIPAAAKVRSYPIVERDGVVWIWPGNLALADESKIVDLSDMLGVPGRPIATDFFVVNAHVGLLLDNIMDLTHAPHIHHRTFADLEDMQTMRTELEQEGDSIWSKNYIPRSRTSELFKRFRPADEEYTSTIAHMKWSPPSVATLVVGSTACDKSHDEGLKMFFVHLLMPMSENKTKYWWMATRDFALESEQVTAKVHQQVQYAFTHEDEPAVVACAENMSTNDLMALNPVFLPGDGPAMRVRRMIDRLEREEAAAATA